jgi:predicted glycoside hydrolase/deacetylase ChbG (UPF0249 family)
MMVRQPGWAHALQHKADIPIGLHLNLLVGGPLEKVPSLTAGNGRFRSITSLTRGAVLGHIDIAEVEAETRAQIAALVSEGITLTHVDSHRHVHALPGIRAGVVAAAAAAGIREVRAPVEERPTLLGIPAVIAKAGLLRTAWMAGRPPAPAAKRHFAGLALYDSGSAFLDRLERVLKALPAGPVELIVHPGRPDAALAALDDYLDARISELDGLTSARGRKLIAAANAA